MNNRRSILCRTVLAAVLVAYASIHVDAAHRVEPSAVFRPHSRSSSLKVLPQTVPTTIGGRPEEALALRGGVANTLPNAFVASIVMALIEKGVKEGLKAANVKFPAQLGGCIFLFSFMMLAEKINPELGNAIFEALSPGAGILAKWLPVFFVPGLALLPLSPKIGTSVDVSFVSGEMLVLALRFRCWVSLEKKSHTWDCTNSTPTGCQSHYGLLSRICLHRHHHRCFRLDRSQSTRNPGQSYVRCPNEEDRHRYTGQKTV